MNSSSIKVFSTARTWLISLSTLGLMGVSSYYSGNSTAYQSLMNMKSALQICSTRVGQTHTASVLGDSNSIYLDSNFTGATEECFADLQGLVEDNKLLGKDGVKKINAVSTNVHWFSESLRSSGTGFSVKNNNVSNISNKFSDVEDSIEKFSENMNREVESLSTKSSNLKISLILIAAVLLLSGLYEVVQRRVFKRKKKEIENEALSELLSKDETTAGKVEGIIKNALELNEMGHCSKLMATYRANIFESSTSRVNEINSRPVAFANKKLSQSNELVNAIWEESENQDSSDVQDDIANANDVQVSMSEESQFNTSIGHVIEKVYSHLSAKIGEKSVDITVDYDQAQINANEESLEQALYYIINDGIENLSLASSEIDEVKLFIKGKSLGSIYNFAVESHGEGRKGEESTNFLIANEISRDANGRMESSNLYSSDKKVIGRKVRLILKSAKKTSVTTIKSEPSLVRLERGTKKELMARLNA